MDFEATSDNAKFLQKLSQKAYVACNNELKKFSVMKQENLQMAILVAEAEKEA